MGQLCRRWWRISVGLGRNEDFARNMQDPQRSAFFLGRVGIVVVAIRPDIDAASFCREIFDTDYFFLIGASVSGWRARAVSSICFGFVGCWGFRGGHDGCVWGLYHWLVKIVLVVLDPRGGEHWTKG